MVEMVKQLIVKDEQSSNSAANTKKPGNNQDYISIVPDDVLIKIFLRLSNIRSVSQCSRVRKSWFSLISLHKQLFYSSHDTVVFSFCIQHRLLFQPFMELFLQNSHTQECILNFLPDWHRVTIRASCDDLLLASCGLRDYFICNTLTSEWIALPKAPPIPSSYYPCGYGLASEPNKSLHNYRAVVVHTACFQREWGSFTFDVFCSESGRWIELIYKQICLPFSLREAKVSRDREIPIDIVVTQNGALYWLDGNGLICVGIISFHPYTKTCRYIEFPPSVRNWAMYYPTKWNQQLGAVRGRLRLLMVRRVNHVSKDLEIWELDDDNNDDSYSWVRVHKVLIGKRVFVLSFHPSNTDVVFLMRGREILSLHLGENKYDKVGEIPSQGHGYAYASPEFMKVFPLKHYSNFPTQVAQVTATTI